MKYLFFAIGIFVLGFTMHSNQIAHHLEKYVYDSVDYALKHAVHDAALQINRDLVGDGFTVYEPALADEVFIQGLMNNLPLDETLTPNNSDLIDGQIKVVGRYFIDDLFFQGDSILGGLTISNLPAPSLPLDDFGSTFSCLSTDAVNGGFPCSFTYTNPSLNIKLTRPISGPSAVYIVNVKAKGSPEPISYITIQEYKN